MAKFVSEAFEELKKQVESLGLDEKSKSKFLMGGMAQNARSRGRRKEGRA